MPRLTKAEKAAQLERDARNRALRTFLQGLALDIGVAVALLVYDAVQADQPDYRLLLASLIKTVLQVAASYVMRRLVDPSRIRTPLPPDPPGEPDADAGYSAVEWILLLAAGTALGLVLGTLLLRHI